MTISPTLLRQIGAAAFGPSHWQAELANALQVNPRTVRSWLSGRSLPSAGVAQELAEIMEIRAQELYHATLALVAARERAACPHCGNYGEVHRLECPEYVDPRDPDHSRTGIFVYHNCSRCNDGRDLSRCPTPNTPGNCGYPHARDD